MSADLRASRTWSLLADGSLNVSVADTAANLVRTWVPRLSASERASAAPSGAACIRLGEGGLGRELEVPVEAPAVEIVSLRGWVGGRSEQATLLNHSGELGGIVDLARLEARIEVLDPAANPHIERDVFCALTVASGLLLNRQQKILLHAGGFVAPDGRAWLLVGDSGSGKSSTCANLIRYGWHYLADDQVVVCAAGSGFRVEGWPRAFNLDDGFHAGSSVGRRSPVDPTALGSGQWQRSAPLGGLLFPVVAPAESTHLHPVHGADALSGLIRQSPWILADRQAAPAVLAMMHKLVAAPAHRLVLGTDTYADPALLSTRLRPVLDG